MTLYEYSSALSRKYWFNRNGNSYLSRRSRARRSNHTGTCSKVMSETGNNLYFYRKAEENLTDTSSQTKKTNSLYRSSPKYALGDSKTQNNGHGIYTP